MAKTKDYDVRRAVIERLISEGFDKKDIRQELTLDTNSSDGRADIVVLTEQGIWGIEIKSGSDKLDRVMNQHSSYELAFDGTFFVIDKLHCEKFDTLRGMVKYKSVAWCHDTKTFITQYGNPVFNLRHQIQIYKSSETSVVAMARLLWKEEICPLSKSLGGPGGTRCGAISWLHQNANLKELRPLVTAAIKARVPNRWEETFWKRFGLDQQSA